MRPSMKTIINDVCKGMLMRSRKGDWAIKNIFVAALFVVLLLVLIYIIFKSSRTIDLGELFDYNIF